MLRKSQKRNYRYGADPNSTAHGRTPLYEAASAGFADVCELLIKGGADPNVEVKGKNGQKHTALSIAARWVDPVCSTPAHVCVCGCGRTRRNGSVVSRGSSNSDGGNGGGCCVLSWWWMLMVFIKTNLILPCWKFNQACPPHFWEERFWFAPTFLSVSVCSSEPQTNSPTNLQARPVL